jgi:hypothetical protein
MDEEVPPINEVMEDCTAEWIKIDSSSEWTPSAHIFCPAAHKISYC